MGGKSSKKKGGPVTYPKQGGGSSNGQGDYSIQSYDSQSPPSYEQAKQPQAPYPQPAGGNPAQHTRVYVPHQQPGYYGQPDQGYPVGVQGMPPSQGMYGQPVNTTHYVGADGRQYSYHSTPGQVAMGTFEAGTRRTQDGVTRIPPPPPGAAPTAAQMAVMSGQGEVVVMNQNQSSLISGGGDGGMTIW
eukprot:Nk52_evm58s217 gene=Nk52_evmTU58s217